MTTRPLETALRVGLIAAALGSVPAQTAAQEHMPPVYVEDRGTGQSRFGTFTFRMAAEYSVEESSLASGEYAVEYLKRLSSSWRLYLGVDGTQDEVELINEVQWQFNDRVFLKINNGFGLTSKATDWAPEVGVMFSVPATSKN